MNTDTTRQLFASQWLSGKDKTDTSGKQKLFAADGLGWTGLINADNINATANLQNGLFSGIASIISAARNKSNTSTVNLNQSTVVEKKTSNIWLWGSIGAAAIAVIVVVIVLINKKKNQ